MVNDWSVIIDREAARCVADDLAQQGVRVATIPRTGKWGGYYVVPIDYVAEPAFTEKLRKSISGEGELKEDDPWGLIGEDTAQ